MLRFVAALWLLAALAGSADAATRRVPSEYPTIQAAVNASANGDIVLVAPGQYAPVRISAPVGQTISLQLRSERGPDATFIEGRNGTGVLIERGQNVEITGFTIRHCNPYGIQLRHSTGASIHNNVIHDNPSSGIDLPGRSYPPLQVTIEQNTIVANAYGILWDGTAQVTAKKNIVWRNTQIDIGCFGSVPALLSCNLGNYQFCSPGPGDIIGVDPLFVDYQNRNLCLQPATPAVCLDDGTTLGANLRVCASDVSVRSLEVNQGVAGTTFFVAGRPTIVRATIATSQNIEGLRGQLTWTRDDGATETIPAYNEPFEAKLEYDSTDKQTGNNTLNFRFIPDTTGTYQFSVMITTFAPDPDPANNIFIDAGVYMFQETRGPHSGGARMRINVETLALIGESSPRLPDALDATSAINKMYPLRQGGVATLGPTPLPSRTTRYSEHDLPWLLLLEEAALRIHNLFSPTSQRWDRTLVLLTPSLMPIIDGDTLLGEALIRPGSTLAVGTFAYRQHTPVHELGHTFGLPHTEGGDIVEPGAFDPYCRIPAHIRPGTSIPRWTYMVEGGKTLEQVWTQRPQYEEAFAQLVSPNMTSADPAALEATSEDHILGRVVSDGTTVRLLPFQGIAMPSTTSSFPGGRFQLQTKVAGTLQTVGSFDLATAAESGEQGEPLGFMFFLPRPQQLEEVRVVESGTPVAIQAATLNAPSIDILAPTGDESISDSLHITWTASDVDADPLEYAVFLSLDRGGTWDLIDADISDTQYICHTANWPQTSDAVVRVTATDGFHVGVATSPPFSVTSKVPSLAVENTGGSNVLPYGAPADLVAHTWDPEDGDTQGTSITWSSSLDGSVGAGHYISTSSLSLGTHVITATATDTDGHVATDDEAIEIRDDTAPIIHLLTTNGAEQWCSGQTLPIQWRADDNHGIERVELTLSTDGGITYPISIATVTGTQYSWTVPPQSSDRCLVRVRAWDASGNFSDDVSSQEFTINNSASCIPVAVQIGNLVATADGSDIILRWHVPSSAVNTLQGIHVERTREDHPYFEQLTPEALTPTHDMTYRDTSPEPHTTYLYRLLVTDKDGGTTPTAAITATLSLDAVRTLGLHITSVTSDQVVMEYELPHASRVKIAVYDVGGRHVRSLHDGEVKPGRYTILWDQRDRDARAVASGVYFVRLATGTRALNTRLVLIR